MGDDLSGERAEVHVAAAAVLDFWFDELTPAQHFARDEGLDRLIAAQFGRLRDRVLATRAERWRDEPATLLAAVILIDQFSRNIHRGSAEAFAGDRVAQALTMHAIDHGWDADLPDQARHFLYMPLMHAEDRAMQALSLEKFATLSNPETLDFARQHAEVIDRFGRFPGRNEALGRRSTDEEFAWLSRPGGGAW